MKTVFLIVYLFTAGGPTMHVEKVQSTFVCEQLGKAAIGVRENPSSGLLYSTYRCVTFKNQEATADGGHIQPTR